MGRHTKKWILETGSIILIYRNMKKWLEINEKTI